MPPDDPDRPKPAAPNGHANGATSGDEALDDAHDALPEPDAELEPSPDPRDAPPPPAVAELAAACVRFVAAKYKVPLDFEPDTLSLVDQYARDARAELAVKPEALDVIQASIGAYLGETMRRAFGATWFCEGDHDGWRLDFTYVYLTFNPIGMAREALTQGAAEGWHAHLETDEGERELLESKLAVLGEIDEEEYYMPSTRFDVVEIAVDTLRAKMEQSGLGHVTFDPDDYEKK
jgi:hypothetical protein